MPRVSGLLDSRLLLVPDTPRIIANPQGLHERICRVLPVSTLEAFPVLKSPVLWLISLFLLTHLVF